MFFVLLVFFCFFCFFVLFVLPLPVTKGCYEFSLFVFQNSVGFLSLHAKANLPRMGGANLPQVRIHTSVHTRDWPSLEAKIKNNNKHNTKKVRI